MNAMMLRTLSCEGDLAMASFVASNCDVRCLRLRTVNTLTCMDGLAGHGVAADGNSRNT